MIKQFVAALVALLSIAFHANAQWITGFDDIEFWAGSGDNRSALVFQWNDGGSPASLAWGYRWDGSVNGMDMLKAIAGTTIIREPGGGDVIEILHGADSALELVIERYGFGDALYSIVYNPPGGGQRTQADWDSGWWEYLLFAGNFDYYTWTDDGFDGPFTYDESGSHLYSGVVWEWAQIGAVDRLLVDGSWDAWSFAAGFASVPVQQPAAAVPEPGVLGLLAAAAFAAIAARRIRRAS